MNLLWRVQINFTGLRKNKVYIKERQYQNIMFENKEFRILCLGNYFLAIMSHNFLQYLIKLQQFLKNYTYYSSDIIKKLFWQFFLLLQKTIVAVNHLLVLGVISSFYYTLIISFHCLLLLLCFLSFLISLQSNIIVASQPTNIYKLKMSC